MARDGRFTANAWLTRVERLLDNLHTCCWLATSRAASLLHGDLWSGNKAFTWPDGRPVIFDPARLLR